MPEGRRQRKRNYMLFEENAINANPGPNGIGAGDLPGIHGLCEETASPIGRNVVC
jgi:hypothetical protein